MKKRNEEFSIKELLNIFLAKMWLIVIVAMVFGFAMAFYSAVIKDDTYTSTTRIHISKNTSGSSDLNVSDVEFATFYLQTYVELIKVPDFLDKVVANFKESVVYQEYAVEKGWQNLTGASIRGYISTSTVQDILTVSVTTGDPNLSYGLADSIQDIISQTEEPVLAYPTEIVTPYTIQLPKIQGANSRNVPFNAVLGAAAGAAVSMALIFVADLLDVTIRDKKKLEDNFDVPVLGVIPRFISDEGKSKK